MPTATAELERKITETEIAILVFSMGMAMVRHINLHEKVNSV